jgi:chaperonin cofactor prefoldin
MQNVIDMAKAHLQNVANKIQELQNQKQIIQTEIDKLTTYLNDGLVSVDEASKSN